MAIRDENGPFGSVDPSIAVEFALVTAVLVGVYVWRRLVEEVLSAITTTSLPFGGILIGGLVSGGLLVAGLALFTAAYASYRDIDVGLALPARGDLAPIGLAGVVPVVLVGLTKLVGTLTGVAYNSLTMTSYAIDAQITPVLLVAGLALVVGVPALVLVCQVLVQGSFERAVGSDVAIVLTTLVTGFVMVSDTGRLVPVPDEGKLVGAVLFAVALGVGLYATEHVASQRLRFLAYLPSLLLAALVVLSGIAEIGSVAGGLFVATHLAVLGVAAYVYDRTDSLLAPGLAYASLLLANRTVVFVFEAGMQNW